MPLFAYLRVRPLAEMSLLRGFAKKCPHRRNKSAKSCVRPFEEIPAPKSWPLVGTTLALIAEGGAPKLHRYVDMRHKQLGPIFREKLGPISTIFVSDPEEMRSVFAQEGAHPRHILPEAWVVYNNLHGCSRGLFFMDGPEWKENRRILNNFLLKTGPNWIEDCCDLVGDLTIRTLESQIDQEIVNLEEILYKWSLDVIIAILLGPEDYRKNHERFDSDVKKLSSIVHLVFETSAKLQLIPAMSLAAKFRIPRWEKFARSVDGALSNANQFVDVLMRVYNSEQCVGLLPKLLRENVELDVIRRIVVDFILAAGDTTAYAFEWILYLIGKNPQVQERLRRDPDLARNVIKEGLRLYPVAPFLTRILPEDSVISGYAIPKNSLIILSIFTSGRDEHFFKDPLKFDPDRWNRDHCDYNVAMQRASLPFAMGSRSCIGKKIAETQLQLTLAKIVQRFHVQVCNETDVDVVLKMVAVPEKPIRLKFTEIKKL